MNHLNLLPFGPREHVVAIGLVAQRGHAVVRVRDKDKKFDCLVGILVMSRGEQKMVHLAQFQSSGQALVQRCPSSAHPQQEL